MIKSFFKNNAIHKKIVPIFDILFLFRPTLFFVVWLMVSIGFYLGYLLNENINNYQWIFTFNYHTFSLYLAITLLTGASFVTNQISDVRADKTELPPIATLLVPDVIWYKLLPPIAILYCTAPVTAPPFNA